MSNLRQRFRVPIRVPIGFTTICYLGIAASTLGRATLSDAEPPPPACVAGVNAFEDEVWAKVGSRICLNCHNTNGDASDSRFLLQDPARDPTRSGEALAHNRQAFERVARARKADRSLLLSKVVGNLAHGGGEVLEPGSTGYRVLERFVARLTGTPAPQIGAGVTGPVRPFFEGVDMLPPDRLLRRVALSLVGRLPTSEERAAVGRAGLDAFDQILDGVMREDAFYERLKEGFNDILLVRGLEDVAERVLSYDHFSETRHWTQKFDLSHIPEKDRQKARYKLTDDYREAKLREPLELIAYIVRNDRPFTEIVTADYIMVSPYTSRGYGIHDEVKTRFKDPDDPFEYVPTRLKALKSRDGKVQESATGYYPHAGLLGMFHYLQRYPTTDTNRNRLRARMYYQHFLGIDIMQLAPRVTDAAAIDAKYEIPTMQAPDCVVCHKTIDPVAGLFQDFDKDGYLIPPKGGWYEDMFGPGHEGEPLPPDQKWRATQWLGERTAKDPRFAVAMVQHVYTILMGRPVLQPPQDIDDPEFAAGHRAYREQRRVIEEVARRFRDSGFDLKVAFKGLIASEFYRADRVATALKDPCRRAELDEVSLVRLLTPEQLERKLAALFGKKWGRLDDQFLILYGGIDSKAVTERMTDPSGAMGAIQRIMANDVACQNVGVDFTTPPAERRLFPDIEPDVVPGSGPEAEAKIRRAIVHLHHHLLGREDAVDDPEVERTYQLFAGIVADAKARQGVDPRESYFCRGVNDQRLDDPHYTIRAWRGVVTYLLRQHEFLYE